MRNIIHFITICIIVCSSCSDNCIQKIHSGTLVVDLTDSTIVQQFKGEANDLVNKLSPVKINRCEGVKVDIVPIGSTIENQTVTVSYPASGSLDKGIGGYALEDSNAAKSAYLVKHITESVNSFTTVGDSKSQIFYTINYLLQHKSGRCIIFTDLLENYDHKISFYKTGYNFETTLKKIVNLYGIDTTVKTSFGGKLTIVTPMTKHQDQILYARSFYKFYFTRIGLSSSQYEFVGSLSQSKF